MTGTFFSEMIQNKEKFAHCSSIIELPDKNLMVSFYAGTAEANPDNKVYICIYNKKKGIWEESKVILDTPGKPNGNAVLYINKNNRIYLFNNTIHREWRKFPRVWNWALTDNKVMYSDDLGKTWSENAPLFPDKIGLNFKNKALSLKDGTTLLSTYDDYYFKSYILISTDMGGTWQISNPIETEPYGSGFKHHYYKFINKHFPLFGNIQPSLIEKNNGDILAFLRPKNFKRILVSQSKDGGKSWSKTRETEINNPQSGIDAVKLTSGNIVLGFNDSATSRSILKLKLSEDEGASWIFEKELENEEKQEFSYPAIIQDSEGFIHITYTFKRKCIKYVKTNEEWLKS